MKSCNSCFWWDYTCDCPEKCVSENKYISIEDGVKRSKEKCFECENENFCNKNGFNMLTPSCLFEQRKPVDNAKIRVKRRKTNESD